VSPSLHQLRDGVGSIIAIFVKTLTGKTITIEIWSLASRCQPTQGKIKGHEGIPADQQRLIFGLLQLEDGEAFEDMVLETAV